jgi:hypothetical protein
MPRPDAAMQCSAPSSDIRQDGGLKRSGPADYLGRYALEIFDNV